MEKIYFAKNIKFLRNRDKLSQESLGQFLSMTRSKVNALETGHTKSPTMEDLLAFSAYFKVSVDSMLKIDLQPLGELKLRELQAGNDVYIRGGNLRVLAITVNQNNEENVELVPVKAKAGYRAGYNDPSFIQQLPRYRIPGLPKGKTYRIFPTTGDSMFPIPENSLVIGAFVNDLTSIRTGSLCVVVLKGTGEDFVFKNVENRLLAEGCFVLHSLNELYAPYHVMAEDVLEMWQMTSYISDTVPTGNITMGAIASALKDIQIKVDGLSK